MDTKDKPKRLTRKKFLSVSAATIGAGALAACTPPAIFPTAAPAKAKVTMWAFPLTDDDAAIFRVMQEAFTTQNPNIEVDVQLEPWGGRETKMLTAIAAGNPPDCVYLNPDFYPKFVDADALVPLDQFMPSGFRDDFMPGALSAVTYDGKTFGLPILMSAFSNPFNKALFDQAGIAELPGTWDTFKDAVRKIRNLGNDIWGGFFDLARPSPVTTFIPFLRMAGGSQFTADGKDIAFDGPEGLEALEYLVGFFKEDLCQKANITGGGLPFSSGQIGCYIQAENGWVRRTLVDNPELQMVIPPCLKHTEQSNFGTVGSYAIFKLSKNHEAAAKWLEFVTNRENTITILKASGFLAPRASIKPEDYSTGVIADIAAQVGLMRSEPRHILAREVMAAQQPEFEAAFLGSKTPAEALKVAADAARKILAAA